MYYLNGYGNEPLAPIYYRDTPTIDPFPPVNPSWFVNGLPDNIPTQGAGLSGSPIDFIPIDVISKSAISSSTLSLNPASLSNFDGYIDTNGTFHPVVPQKIQFSNVGPGMRVVTLFYKKGSVPWIDGCKVHGKGKWVLLSDFGGIEPGSTATKSISYKQGVNQTNAESLSFTVGAKVGGTLEGITGELSASLTSTFSSSVTITEETTVTDTISFQAQDKEQRVGAYQFYRNYFVEPGQALVDLTNKQKGDSRQPMYNEINRAFDYKTNHFQKVFVLAPDDKTSIL